MRVLLWRKKSISLEKDEQVLNAVFDYLENASKSFDSSNVLTPLE